MGRKLPPLNALRSFEAAARHLSFTRAAEELHVTHGAISRQVKALEDYFHQPLFSRVKGRLQLNAAGTRLYRTVKSVLNEVEQTARQLMPDPQEQARLSINVTSAFAALWLMPRLTGFQEAHPDLTISLSPSAEFDSEGFAEGAFDVAIRWEAARSGEVEMVPLLDIDTFPACSPALMLEERKVRRPEDLLNHMLIHDDDGEAWSAWFGKAGINDADLGRSRYYSDSQLALQAAVNGQGVIAAGSVLAAQELSLGRLVIPFGPVIRNRHTYCLYYPKAKREDPHVAAFRDWLETEVKIYGAERVDVEIFMVR